MVQGCFSKIVMFHLFPAWRTRKRRFIIIVIIVLFVATVTYMYTWQWLRCHPEIEYMKFVEQSRKQDLDNPFIHKHNYKFLLNNSTVCKDEVFLLVYILSDRQNKLARRMIRETWGSVRQYRGANIRFVFLLGDDNDGRRKLIEAESKIQLDIIQGNFLDEYDNLTYKSVMGLHWVNEYCNNTKFVLKTDDDVMVNIFKMVRFLQEVQTTETTSFLYCNVEGKGWGVPPIRTNSSKFYVDFSEYSANLYPPYCHGVGYIFSNNVASRLLHATKHVPFVKYEDVFIGFCAQVAGIVLQDLISFGFYKAISKNANPKFDFVLLKHTHTTSKEDWGTMWKSIQSLPERHDLKYYNSLILLFIAICLLLVFTISLFLHCLYKNCARKLLIRIKRKS